MTRLFPPCLSKTHRFLALLVTVIILSTTPAVADRRGGPALLLPESTLRALADELSGAAALRTVEELALHHRMRGSQGFRAAAETVRAKLESYGLEGVEILELPADGKIFYGTQRSRPGWDVDFAELWEERLSGDTWVDGPLISSWQTRPITLAQDSASGAATAELVDVGRGVSPADYEGKGVRGKLVLTSSQPGAVAALAVTKHGAAGIISWAQNQRTAWWGEDGDLVRWGHLNTFPTPATFAFMVSPNQAKRWQKRLGRGERVRLRAQVKAGQHPSAYAIATAVIPGAGLAEEEIVFSCHLDHQRPGANDNASGCATILEVARTLSKLIRDGKLPTPLRTLRFIWPPEIEGTIALLNARPYLAARAKAAIHLDMVGGGEVTKAIFHVTRSPASLPTVVNDIAEAFGRFVDRHTYAHAAGEETPFALVDPEGSRQALRAHYADYTAGSDHQVWAEGSFRVPTIYLNDWPDRYIHTHADHPRNIDPSKLLRAAFIAATSGYYLANLGADDLPGLLRVTGRHAIVRTAAALARAQQLDTTEAANLLRHHLASERTTFASALRYAPPDVATQRQVAGVLSGIEWLALSSGVSPEDLRTPSLDAKDQSPICKRRPEPKGPLWGFGYSYFDDHLKKHKLSRPNLLSYNGLWGSGSDYAYEALNLVDGERSVRAVRDALAAIYGPVPVEQVAEYLETLLQIGILDCGSR